MRRLGTCLLHVCLLIIFIPQSASAHAYVVKSNPTE
ncbi:copper resistance protein, partial [Bacillus cereus]|nr:copper resistance protein [Bacillus cereus]